MKLLIRRLLVFLLCAGSAVSLPGATAPQTAAAITPGSAVLDYATARAIPVEGFEIAEGDASARPDDRLTVLFTIQDGARSRQWLGEFRSAALTDREAKSTPGTGLGMLSFFVSSLNTDTGHSFSFTQSPAALEIHTHGPFDVGGTREASPEPVAETTARVLATRGYLMHGLAPMGEIELRLRAAGKQNPGLSFMFRPSYSDEQMTAAKTRTTAAGFTEEDERVYAESIFALVQFASLAFRTNGVDAIMREIADSPTLFSGAFVNLDWNKLQLEDGGEWGLPTARVFRLPYTLQSKTKAGGSFFITAPRPPLQNVAGIIGLTVDWTSKPPGKRLIMRVLASRRGEP